MTLSRKIPLPESRSADRAPSAGPEPGDLAQFTGLTPQK